MKTDRMVSRIPSSDLIGRATLRNKRVVFNKRSKDGSGKANLVDSVGSITWGVLYSLDFFDIVTLDKIEGGYRRTEVKVQLDDGTSVKAKTYVSMNTIDKPIAYDWYKKLVVEGAREHDLPEDYIRYLEHLSSKVDASKTNAC